MVLSFLISGTFFAAWYAEAQNRFRNPPGGVVNLNEIQWMIRVGGVSGFIGVSLLTDLVIGRVASIWTWRSTTSK
jgi:hypothetical protein